MKIPIVIAEVASNHEGDLSKAKAFVDAVAQSGGASIIKFQSWQKEKVPSDHSMKDFFNARELTDEMHRELIAYCNEKGLEFLTTVYAPERVKFCFDLGLKRIKVASTYTGRPDLLDEVLSYPWQVIASTGMSKVEDVEQLVTKLRPGDVILHCVSLYPVPPEKANIARMDWLKELVGNRGITVGYSDHTEGVQACQIATSQGAEMLEKHISFTPKPHELDPSRLPELTAGFTGSATAIKQYLGTGNPEMDLLEQETFKKFDHLLG